MSGTPFEAIVHAPGDGLLQHYAADVFPGGNIVIRGASKRHDWYLADDDNTVLRERETHPARLVDPLTGDPITDELDMELAKYGHIIQVYHNDEWKDAGKIVQLPKTLLNAEELGDR